MEAGSTTTFAMVKHLSKESGGKLLNVAKKFEEKTPNKKMRRIWKRMENKRKEIINSSKEFGGENSKQAHEEYSEENGEEKEREVRENEKV